MRNLLWCVLVLVGCKGTTERAPVGKSGSANGSDEGRAVAPPIDAFVGDAETSTDAAVSIDAAVSAAVPADKLISAKGVGPITATTPRASIGRLFPGTTIKREQQETEDQNYEWISIFKDKKLSLKILVDNTLNDKAPNRVLVDDPSFATADGIHVGSTGADFAAAYKTATCKAETWDEEPRPQLYCEVKGAGRLLFYFEAKGAKIKVGSHELATIAAYSIKEIMWSVAEPYEED